MRYHALALVLCCFAGPTYGQSAVPLRLGQRVWVRSLTVSGALDGGVRGTLEGVIGDSLRIRQAPEGQAISVRVGPKVRVFVSTGRRSNIGRGAAIGGGVGAVAGGIMGYASGQDCNGGEWLCFDRQTVAGMGAVSLGFVGLLGGLVVGALVHHDIWAPTGWDADCPAGCLAKPTPS